MDPTLQRVTADAALRSARSVGGKASPGAATTGGGLSRASSDTPINRFAFEPSVFDHLSDEQPSSDPDVRHIVEHETASQPSVRNPRDAYDRRRVIAAGLPQGMPTWAIEMLASRPATFVPDVAIPTRPELTPETQIADPGLADNPDHADFDYIDVDGELYVDGIAYSDVVQGAAADCYFMATLAAIAVTNPSYLEGMITDNGDGTYTVEFGGELGQVTVDDDFLTYPSGNPVYAGMNSEGGAQEASPELWVAIIEKAYAQGKGSYSAIEWDYASVAFGDLTGSSDISVTAAADFEPQDLEQSLANGSAMTAGTYGDDKKYVENGLVSAHVYTVLGFARDKHGNVRIGEDGQPMIELYNPWGRTEYSAAGDGAPADGVDDGVFAMSWTEFQQQFSGVTTLGTY